MKVIFLGSGNLATRLSLEMHRKGMTIGQVYSYTPENARQLAGRLGCLWTTDLEAIETDADLYVFSLKDTVLANVITRIRPNDGLCTYGRQYADGYFQRPYGQLRSLVSDADI